MGGGEILRSSGNGAGQSVDFVRLLYIIRFIFSSIDLPSGKGSNITTCYVV